MENGSVLGTEGPGAACALEIRSETELVPVVSCCAGFALAIAYCFCGCRWPRAVLLVSGLALGSAAGHLLCVQARVLDVWARAGVSLGLGLLAGLLAALLRAVGLFLTGLFLGLLLSGAALLLLGQLHPLLPAWLPPSALLGSGLLCAAVALRWSRAVTAAAAAALGALLAVACVGLMLETPVWETGVYEGLRRWCWYSWALLGTWPVLGALGTMVQYRITTAAHAHGKRQQLDLQRSRRSRERRKPKAIQRCTGDTLAPSYLASLRERQMNTGSSLWSLTSVHHTLIDFDSETGSLVPLTTSASALLRL